FALALLGFGCADDLTPERETAKLSAKVVTEAGADGGYVTHVDASSRDSWIYFSFASRAEVTPGDPLTTSDWELGFQRFDIVSNGGVSGTGGASVAALADAMLDAVTQAPSDGYVEDQADSDDDDMVADSAFLAGDGWYDYDTSNNTLSPKPIVYVVHVPSGA